MYMCRTWVQVGEKEMFEVLDVLLFAMWTAFVVYVTWYFTSAKRYAPLTLDEARILWRIHKQNVRCSGRKWRKIRCDHRIVGFQCECGYVHVQKRPMVINPPTVDVKSENAQLSVAKRLHTSYESA